MRRLVLLSTIILAVMCSFANAVEPIDIGSRLEPMVDDFLIEKMDGAALKLHKPIAREVAIVHDQPWEGNVCGYWTVFKDDGLYRMYYRGGHYDSKLRKVAHKEVVCYAESDDGVHWRKPELGIVEFKGSKKNNIILLGKVAHAFTPFKDTNQNCKPDEKYKAVSPYCFSNPSGNGLFALKSTDGIHWSYMSKKPIIAKKDFAFDSQNLAFWDNERGCYVSFFRGWQKGVRDILTCTSKDFVNWTEPVWIEYPGSPTEHLYTNAITPYFRAPHMYMGFPKRFMPKRRTRTYVEGVSDGIFMTSRDGRNFKRWREAIIRPGLQKERWVSRNNMTAWGILTTKSNIPGTPDELSIYSSEGYYDGDSCQLRRYSIRMDGFVSVEAPLAGGEMVTKPIVFKGKQLVINCSTSAAGSIQVEIQDADGKPIPGFTLADSPEFYGDAIEHVVAWKGGSDVSKLAGKPIRLRFVMKDADLYSIRFR